MDFWKIIDVYFRSNKLFLTKHHLQSYNDFVLNKIPYIIDTLNPITILKEDKDYKIEVIIDKNYRIQNPKIDDEILLPNTARMQNMNYFAELISTVTVNYFTFDHSKNSYNLNSSKEFKDKIFGKIPILVHSKFCYLNGLSNESLSDIGECPYDHGGYFIVDGKEKVIISQERIATNQLFLNDSKEPELYRLEGMIRSTSIVNNLFPKTVYFWVCNVPDSYEFTITMKIMNINLEQIPLCIIFRALGIESDRDILNYISFDDDDMDKLMRRTLVQEEDDKYIYSQSDALQYLSNFVKFKKDEDYVKYIFINDLFPNVGDSFHDKAMYLGYLIKQLVLTSIGVQKKNERDNYMFKRVDTTGILLGNIFRDFYNKYRNNILNEIDREYNTGGGLKDNYNLVNEGNFSRIFNGNIIAEGLYKSMKGNWGLTGDPSEQGIVQDVSRLSYIGYVSHMRRVNTPIDRSIKLVAPHRLDSAQWGMMCPIESPDGGNIGLLKHMTAACEISLESSRSEIIECLSKLNLIQLKDITPYSSKDKCKVILNNNWIGIHNDAKDLYDNLIKYRRSGILNSSISISWKIFENEIVIFSDSGRCIRPVIVVKDKDNLDVKKNWNDYVNGYTYEYTYDPKKENKNTGIEYIDCYESNSLYIAMNEKDITKYHSHLEIHPCLCVSMYTNTIPFANHNQAPRNVFSGQQGKQALGIYSTSFNHRIDTASYLLHYPQRGLVTTKMAKYAYKNNMPNGENLIVAIATYTGYNQEDSIIVNKSSIQRGMFNVSSFKSIVEAEDENIFTNEKVVFDNALEMQKQGKNINFKRAKWDKIDENGFPKLNSYIEEDDVYVGKINVKALDTLQKDNNIFSENTTLYNYKDSSKVADKTISGTIDKIITYKKNNVINMKARIRKFKIPELGDKMASSHGQKGVCGMIFPQEDMPCSKDGLVPDIIINPHAIPTRMTVAHLVECVLSKLCCKSGRYIDGTIFENHSFEDYYNELEEYGCHKYGDEILYNGFTGEQIKTEIFIGPTFYYRLKHMVKDKINYREANGPSELMTKQPTQGRANGGGLRIGEMETNAILGHGAMQFVKESLMERSDKYSMYVDGQTGENIVYNEEKQLYDSIHAQKIELPYCMKLLQQEIQSLGVDCKMLTKNI